MTRVCHIITGLGTGGAERALERLLSVSPAGQAVVSLRGSGPQEEPLRRLGVPVFPVGLSLSVRLPWRISSFLGLLRRLRPEVLVGWMYHGNLAASLAGKMCRLPVVWNVRHSIHDLRMEKPALRAVIRLGALLSASPAMIVYNSTVAAGQHEALGYRAAKRQVLPNGFDTDEYRPDNGARLSVCSELGVPEEVFLLGHVARFHPMKNHAGLLAAVGQFMRARPDACFCLLMAGTGVEEKNRELAGEVARQGLSGRVRLLGERRDIPRLLAALDVLVSPSWGEGFPNVVAEAMACAVPAIVTDVGDSRHVVGESGRFVPPGSVDAMREALEEFYAIGSEARKELGVLARKRVVAEFGLKKVAERHHRLWNICSG